MKLSFYGAAKAVTGSCYLLETERRRILVDCGLQQGKDEVAEDIPFHPGNVDAVVVTHAHIDHSGRIPLLVKQGFRGAIFATELTCRLLGIMLRDSAHIQESDAQWENQKGKRAGREPVEPLYTMADAEKAIELLVPLTYGQELLISTGITLHFEDAGHMLGSAYAIIGVNEEGEKRKILFSGDIGNINQPIIRDPAAPPTADYVVMESTYGNRNHEYTPGYKENLADIITDTFQRGGNVIIPAFAVGRTQELLYYLREIKEEGLVPQFPDFPVYVDSPLASEATKIFSGDLTGYLDDDALELVRKNVNMFTFYGLQTSTSLEESKALNDDHRSKVIISASGMCDAGRVRHHLKHNLWRKESTVIFVGYQAVGSLGRMLQEGAKEVKLFGEQIAVNAKIERLHGLSAHADRDHLIEWITGMNPPPRHVFVVHGNEDVAPQFAADLQEMGLQSHAPDYSEVYDLITNGILRAGRTPVKKRAKAIGETPAFKKLVAAGVTLMDVIHRNKGGTNKDLGQFTDQIRALIKKWDR